MRAPLAGHQKGPSPEEVIEASIALSARGRGLRFDTIEAGTVAGSAVAVLGAFGCYQYPGGPLSFSDYCKLYAT
jgi:hypothetical protein